MLVEESKLNIERASVVDIESTILKTLDFKIPNFSIRHYLEVFLCIGFATQRDFVYSFLDEKDKERICEKFSEI